MKCGDDEEIVFRDDLFIIVRYSTDGLTPSGFAHEVIPIVSRDDISRLDPYEICPEPESLEEAKVLMESNRGKFAAIRTKIL